VLDEGADQALMCWTKWLVAVSAEIAAAAGVTHRRHHAQPHQHHPQATTTTHNPTNALLDHVAPADAMAGAHFNLPTQSSR
jgi:hypothetical protein